MKRGLTYHLFNKCLNTNEQIESVLYFINQLLELLKTRMFFTCTKTKLSGLVCPANKNKTLALCIFICTTKLPLLYCKHILLLMNLCALYYKSNQIGTIIWKLKSNSSLFKCSYIKLKTFCGCRPNYLHPCCPKDRVEMIRQRLLRRGHHTGWPPFSRLILIHATSPPLSKTHWPLPSFQRLFPPATH